MVAIDAAPTVAAALPPQFILGDVAEQKIVDGRPFPLVILPNPNYTASRGDAAQDRAPGNPNPGLASIRGVADAVAENRGWLEAKLEEHGALLLRGFAAIQKASDFNAVVEACAWAELPYVGGAAPRTNVCGRVFTSNESPPDQKIPFHHEMAQVSSLHAHKTFPISLLISAVFPSFV
jgi:hypothetical protein